MTPPNKDGKKTADRGPAGRFTKGNRASPGRPAGRGKVAELRDKLAQDLDHPLMQYIMGFFWVWSAPSSKSCNKSHSN